jgi:hypothetical protein
MQTLTLIVVSISTRLDNNHIYGITDKDLVKMETLSKLTRGNAHQYEPLYLINKIKTILNKEKGMTNKEAGVFG